MYVCIHVYTYNIYTHVCVCMYVYVCVCLSGSPIGRGCIDRYRYISICMYVCIHLYIYKSSHRDESHCSDS